ncbi:hypothetical protein BN4901_1337 [Citrobacter europaeus]|uniref:Uncharacterized protein n=1 Tax=Citrobacter europaeus TaxID=1914243 RepID=A0ABY0JLM4_9ENTR|nr:hypothetical protein CIP106467_0056 [Citrobacter europaeus]SBW23889.1 hypothetical protein BN4901_1337 [Citrobacter europaeus]
MGVKWSTILKHRSIIFLSQHVFCVVFCRLVSILRTAERKVLRLSADNL